MTRPVVTSHLHGRIVKMTEECKSKGLVVRCDRASDAEPYRGAKRSFIAERDAEHPERSLLKRCSLLNCATT